MSIKVKILDGGLGSELQKRGVDVEDDPLFGSSTLLYNAKEIYTVHTNFLENGADIITTATYQASLQGFCEFLEVCNIEAKSLMKKAANIAQGACEDFWKKQSKIYKLSERTKPQVAGSIGPYGATLLDGSEYHGLYVDTMSIEQLKEWHRPRMECLVNAGIDMFALETIPSMKEGAALVQLIKEFPVKAWLSFSCMDGAHICHGEEFQAAIQHCLQYDSDHRIIAIGVNCTKPTFISSLLEKGSTARNNVPYIVYPNSGEVLMKRKWAASSSENMPKISTFVDEWVSLGAGYIGGCCRTTPEDIASIRQVIYKDQLKPMEKAMNFFGLK